LNYLVILIVLGGARLCGEEKRLRW